MHFRLHHRIGQPHAHRVGFIGTEVDREYAVDLAFFQSFQRGLRRRIGHRLESDIRIFQAARGMSQIIAERSGQFTRLRVLRTERQIIIPIPDANRAVCFEPILLGRRQESIRFSEIEIFFRHPLVEILVFVLNGGQRLIQFFQQVRSVPVDRVIIIRRTNPANRSEPFFGAECVDRSVAVDLAPRQHAHGFGLFRCQRDDLQRKIVFLHPFPQEPLLDAPFVDADPLPVEGRQIVRVNLLVARVDKNIV